MSKAPITAEATTIGGILRRAKFYRVPINQRDYAWTQEEIDTLWDDIKTALENDQAEYFLGAIVLAQVKDEPADYEIVDGQQRLASLSMIFSAISAAWGNKEQAQEVLTAFLGPKDRKSREVTPKLKLNTLNNSVFRQSVLLGEKFTPTDLKNMHRSNRLIVDAHNRLKDHLTNWLVAQPADEESRDDALVLLERFIDESVKVILIEVGDESDAYIIFETLNDRGLELAVADLVKNYLFSLTNEQEIEDFKSLWSEIMQNVGGENLTTFLRHFWLSKYRLVRERELYKDLRKRIKNPKMARTLLQELKSTSESYAALLSPDHFYWSEIPDLPQKYVYALRTLRAAQFRPLALAVMDGGEPSEIRSMLCIVLAITFRYYVTGESVSDLERGYSTAAIAIRSSGKRNPKAIFEHLKDFYISDRDFQDAFEKEFFPRPEVARYVLSQLNNEMETDKGTDVAENITLEHIFPKNANDDWKNSIPADDIDRHLNRIGNLTLLDKGKNRSLGNKNFKEKQEQAYNTSKLAINASLRDFAAWTVQDIEKRSQELAKVAAKIWAIAF